jgi:CHAT domain-containing protein/Tfp pilus assembly protein PilF
MQWGGALALWGAVVSLAVSVCAEAQIVDPPPLASALARQRDAESLASLSTEGRVLFARERIKLGGYQYCSQAVSLAERGDFRQSIRAASKALHLGQSSGDTNLVGSSMRDLAIAYSYAGRLDRAEEYARAALKQETNEPSIVHAPAYKVLGDAAVRRGQTDEAVTHYQRALDLSSERFRPLVEISLANAYVAAGDTVRARAMYERITPPEAPALRQAYERGNGQLLLAEKRPADAADVFQELLTKSGGPDAEYQRLWAYEGLGRSYLALNDTPRAAASYTQAVSSAEAIRAKFRSEEFKSALFGDAQQVFDRALALLMANGETAAALNVSEKSRSRALLDLLRERIPGAPTALQAQAASVSDVVRIQEALAEGEVLVEYHTTDDKLFAWTVRPKRIDGFEIAIGRKALAETVDRFRAGVLARRPNVFDEATSLNELLIKPLNLSSGERLIIVPHGPLHYLAFQALRDANGFLIERHPLVLEPSATVAIDIVQRAARRTGPTVAFGNPATEAKYALPGSEREVERIGKLFPESRVFVREQASKARFMEFAGSGKVLHVAAHAEIDPVDPLFSRILLASGDAGPGYLEAREIFGMEMGGVSLVTLSACESGLGKTERGDEVVGFNRSFLSAGASGLVASLWPVDDDSTEFLMTAMYTELARGTDLMRAMQQAQMESMKRPRFQHPFFWAPFVLVGDWRQRLATQ